MFDQEVCLLLWLIQLGLWKIIFFLKSSSHLFLLVSSHAITSDSVILVIFLKRHSRCISELPSQICSNINVTDWKLLQIINREENIFRENLSFPFIFLLQYFEGVLSPAYWFEVESNDSIIHSHHHFVQDVFPSWLDVELKFLGDCLRFVALL